MKSTITIEKFVQQKTEVELNFIEKPIYIQFRTGDNLTLQTVAIFPGKVTTNKGPVSGFKYIWINSYGISCHSITSEGVMQQLKHERINPTEIKKNYHPDSIIKCAIVGGPISSMLCTAQDFHATLKTSLSEWSFEQLKLAEFISSTDVPSQDIHPAARIVG